MKPLKKEGEKEKYTLKKENIHSHPGTGTKQTNTPSPPTKVSKYLDMLQMSPCTLTWWELPMIQSVRYSTSLFRNFISCRNVSSSRRLIICTRNRSTTRVSSHSCRSQRSLTLCLGTDGHYYFHKTTLCGTFILFRSPYHFFTSPHPSFFSFFFLS